MNRRPRLRTSPLVALVCLLVVVGAAASSSAAPAAERKKPKKLGCEFLKKQPASPTVCVTMTVEAWYQTVVSELGPLPVEDAPTVSPYEKNTLHVGVTAGKEDSRTYLTLDLSDLPLAATVTGGTLVLALNEEEASAPKEVDMKACYVPEPPEKSTEGSLDSPPKPDCSTHSDTRYHRKPQPFFTVDLAPFSDSLATGSGGIVLLPTDSARRQNASWHVALFGKKNDSKGAVAIAALAEYEKLDVDLPGGPGGGGGVGLSGPGGGVDLESPTTGSGGLSFGEPPPLPDEVPSGVSEPVQPVAVGTEEAAPAFITLAPQYSAIWYLPPGLLLGAGFLGYVLTRKIKVNL